MKIKLGDILQDDVGTHWHAIIRQEHISEPGVIRYVLRERTLRLPVRAAICKEDGSEFICKDSEAKMLISIWKEVRDIPQYLGEQSADH